MEGGYEGRHGGTSRGRAKGYLGGHSEGREVVLGYEGTRVRSRAEVVALEI